ncbi:DUF4837 family protein [uncultured Alistipes sp.]|uniref:DUF4837 family protein n=1 Tax=uncultured Alistipes sp. TaxID=538949 RepID=UPI00259745D4|nr:DUF4837 family protein [uncultured Alistipes sp.]
MKTLRHLSLLLLVAMAATACDAFRTLGSSSSQTAQGAPYELLVVCEQKEWNGPAGDTLRSVLTAPVPYLNQTEPKFDVLRVRAQDFTGMLAKHRNIIKVNIDPSITKAATGVEYDVTATPQIVLTLQGPDEKSIVDYVSTYRSELVAALEAAERNRAVAYAEKFGAPAVEQAIERTFGVKMNVPKGYILAAEKPDFIWARYEYPTASQGFFVYSYPYEGSAAMTAEALVKARNRFAARIPGPSEGSYMTTSEVFPPEFRMFHLEGRLWCEMRGFWDVAGDFMGGPFVSYTTVDTRTNRVFTLDGYVYSPKLHKRNFLRGVEHLLYGVEIPGKQ